MDCWFAVLEFSILMKRKEYKLAGFVLLFTALFITGFSLERTSEKAVLLMIQTQGCGAP